jgi:hypothetical protein
MSIMEIGMIEFHAVLTDECGHLRRVDVTASSPDKAYEMLRKDYPESNVEHVILQDIMFRDFLTSVGDRDL